MVKWSVHLIVKNNFYFFYFYFYWKWNLKLHFIIGNRLKGKCYPNLMGNGAQIDTQRNVTGKINIQLLLRIAQSYGSILFPSCRIAANKKMSGHVGKHWKTLGTWLIVPDGIQFIPGNQWGPARGSSCFHYHTNHGTGKRMQKVLSQIKSCISCFSG